MLRKYFIGMLSLFYWRLKNIGTGSVVNSLFVSRHRSLGGYNHISDGVVITNGSRIGLCTYISGPDSVVNEASIGRFCSIARGVKIGLNEHDYTCVTTLPWIFDKNYKYGVGDFKEREVQGKGRTKIGDDVWIGVDSIVARGVEIGSGAVVGAGSVVVKDVPPYSIVAGVPAKVIKMRFSHEVVARLERLQWCDWSVDELKKYRLCFTDINSFLSRVEGDMRLDQNG